MSDIAIRVENCILRPLLSSSKGRVEGLSKLYPAVSPRARHLGRAQSRAGDSPRSQRHDTPSTRLREASLWDRTRLRDTWWPLCHESFDPASRTAFRPVPVGQDRFHEFHGAVRIIRLIRPKVRGKKKVVIRPIRPKIRGKKSEDLWALRDVSFEACPAPKGRCAEPSRRVKQGEVVGIPSTRLRTGIGRNGAGTLAPALRRQPYPAQPGMQVNRRSLRRSSGQG